MGCRSGAGGVPACRAVRRPGRSADDSSGRTTLSSRSGWKSGTSSGIGGLGRPATMTRIRAGGWAGRRPAMLCASGPVVTPRSSSRPSTTRTSRRPRSRQVSAACRRNAKKLASRVVSSRTAGRSWPVRSASCRMTTAMNASRVSWAARRAVMKNATISTRSRTCSGGCSTNVDRSAVLPAQAARPPPRVWVTRASTVAGAAVVGVGGEAEGGEFGELGLAADEFGWGDLGDLLPVRRASRPHPRWWRRRARRRAGRPSTMPPSGRGRRRGRGCPGRGRAAPGCPGDVEPFFQALSRRGHCSLPSRSIARGPGRGAVARAGGARSVPRAPSGWPSIRRRRRRGRPRNARVNAVLSPTSPTPTKPVVVWSRIREESPESP